MIIGLTKWLLALPLIALGLQLKRERTFYKIDGKSVLGNITAVREAKDLIECSFQCIEFGPVPCLSFNLERSNRNVRICELSNTEKYLEPQKIHERPGYDYYGTEFQVSWLKPYYLAFILGCQLVVGGTWPKTGPLRETTDTASNTCTTTSLRFSPLENVLNIT